jgi:pantoate--beta-alanine ligase
MQRVETIAALRAALAVHRPAGRSIGFVPTMGALHEGHLALIRRARAEVDVVVVSIFVNPIQFNDQRDLAAYPRNLDRDAVAVHSERADVLFAPTVEEMYPPGFQTEVRVRDVSRPLEGAARGTAHFDGVATVVSKLFNIVQPSLAYFGQKDAQQVVVIQRMVHDLAIPTEIVVCPTVREADGLAMSSRNVRLDAESRGRAPAIKQALDVAQSLIASGERDAALVAAAARKHLADAGIEPEYCDIVSPVDLQPVHAIEADVLVAIAARVGGVRLIDNMLISPSDAWT